jgi:hypothetical protein
MQKSEGHARKRKPIHGAAEGAHAREGRGGKGSQAAKLMTWPKGPEGEKAEEEGGDDEHAPISQAHKFQPWLEEGPEEGAHEAEGHEGAGGVQMKGGDGGDAGAVRDTAKAGVAGGGGAMPFGDAIQRSFGHHDVSGVRAHTDSAAKSANESMGSQGFAHGNQIAFRGQPDLHTAAHEAAHVVQQRSGVHLKGGVGEAGDRHERHADQVADLVVAGKSAQPLLDRYAPAGGTPVVQHKNTIVDDPTDKTNKKKPGEGRGVLQEDGGKLNTRITFGGLQNGCATSMNATIYPKSDDLEGSTVDAWPPWWAAAAPTSGSFWVQGHLLNMKLGGPGEPRNLTPITKKANARHHSFIEQHVKAAAKKGDGIDYSVLVHYDDTGPRLDKDPTNPKPKVWPKICRGFECSVTIVDKKTGKPKAAPFPLTVLNQR